MNNLETSTSLSTGMSVSKSHILGRSAFGRAPSRTRNNLVAKIHSKNSFHTHIPEKPPPTLLFLLRSRRWERYTPVPSTPYFGTEIWSNMYSCLARILSSRKVSNINGVLGLHNVQSVTASPESSTMRKKWPIGHLIPELKSKMCVVCRRMLLLERCNSSHTLSRTEILQYVIRLLVSSLNDWVVRPKAENCGFSELSPISGWNLDRVLLICSKESTEHSCDHIFSN